MSDEKLFERMASGDTMAAARCSERFGPLIWSLARRLSASEADAEDAVQEVLLSLWRNAAKFDPAAGTATTFVATVARRRLIDRYRARGRRLQALPLNAEPERVPAARVAATPWEETELSPAGFFQRLNASQQEVLRLSLMGLSHNQIAAATSEPIGTIKTNIRRGLIRLRTLVGTEVRAG